MRYVLLLDFELFACLINKLHIGVMCRIYEPMIKNKFRIEHKGFIHYHSVMELLRISEEATKLLG